MQPETSCQPNDLSCDLVKALVEKIVITQTGFTVIKGGDHRPVQIELNWKDENIYGKPEQAVQNRDEPQGLSLLHAIVRAHYWIKALSSGQFESVEGLAAQEGIHPKVMRDKIRLAFAAPACVANIVRGVAPPPDLTEFDSLLASSWQKLL